MNAADTDARQEGAGRDSLRAAFGFGETSMFQDKRWHGCLGLAWMGLPPVPPVNTPWWGQLKPNAHAVAPSAPAAPSPKRKTPKEIRNLRICPTTFLGRSLCSGVCTVRGGGTPL